MNWRNSWLRNILYSWEHLYCLDMTLWTLKRIYTNVSWQTPSFSKRKIKKAHAIPGCIRWEIIPKPEKKFYRVHTRTRRNKDMLVGSFYLWLHHVGMPNSNPPFPRCTRTVLVNEVNAEKMQYQTSENKVRKRPILSSISANWHVSIKRKQQPSIS